MSKPKYDRLVEGNWVKSPLREINYVTGNPIRYNLEKYEFEEIAKGRSGGFSMNMFFGSIGVLVPSILALIEISSQPLWKMIVYIIFVSVSSTAAVIYGITAFNDRKKTCDLYNRIKADAEGLLRESDKKLQC